MKIKNNIIILAITAILFAFTGTLTTYAAKDDQSQRKVCHKKKRGMCKEAKKRLKQKIEKLQQVLENQKEELKQKSKAKRKALKEKMKQNAQELKMAMEEMRKALEAEKEELKNALEQEKQSKAAETQSLKEQIRLNQESMEANEKELKSTLEATQKALEEERNEASISKMQAGKIRFVNNTAYVVKLNAYASGKGLSQVLVSPAFFNPNSSTEIPAPREGLNFGREGEQFWISIQNNKRSLVDCKEPLKFTWNGQKSYSCELLFGKNTNLYSIGGFQATPSLKLDLKYSGDTIVMILSNS